MEISYDITCCGIRELADISYHKNPEDAIRSFGYEAYGYEPEFDGPNSEMDDHNAMWRHAIFSQAGRDAKYGLKLAEFITKHKLGEVATTRAKINPNSGNPLKVWIWTVNHKAVQKWLKKDAMKSGIQAGEKTRLDEEEDYWREDYYDGDLF